MLIQNMYHRGWTVREPSLLVTNSLTYSTKLFILLYINCIYIFIIYCRYDYVLLLQGVFTCSSWY